MENIIVLVCVGFGKFFILVEKVKREILLSCLWKKLVVFMFINKFKDDLIFKVNYLLIIIIIFYSFIFENLFLFDF